MENNLHGSGGLFGRPKQQQQVENKPDTARSISRGQVIEILCSGGKYGIEGLINGVESVYLDDTPLRANNIDNFKGIEVFERKGTPGQQILENFNSEIVSENAVGVEVRSNNPVTRSFINENTSAIRLRLSFVLNQAIKRDGQTVGTDGSSVQFKIFIREGTSNFVERANLTISGKYSEPFEKIWYFPVDTTQDEFFIRIERITGADNTDFRRVVRWESYSVVTETLLPFPRLAYVGLKFNAEDFGQSIPERKYKIGGMYLDIPSNAVVDTTDRGLNFTGNWNGLFTQATKAPADFFAIIWYLLTDEIDGVGDEIKPFMINRFDLYEISKYNNEFIPNGRGGFERRFLFNLAINQQQDGWKLIDSICSGCNVRRIEENGLNRFIQDRPSKISSIVTNADVEQGIFVYSSVDITNIATAVSVTYTDPETAKTKQELFSDASLIAQYGYRLKQIEAVGCTRRSQAIRMAKSVIYNECYETELVTFQSRGFAGLLSVGSVIAVADYNRHTLRIGGLVATGSTATIINLDYPVEIKNIEGFDENFYLILYPDIREAVRTGFFENGEQHYEQFGRNEGRFPNGYLLSISMPDMTVQIRRVTNAPGVYQSLTVDSPFPFIPEKHSNFLIINPEKSYDLYRIESKEFSDDSADVLTITAKQYSEFKWEKIERNLVLDEDRPRISGLNKPQPPQNVKGKLFVISGVDSLQYRIEINWQPSADNFIKNYYVSWSTSNGQEWAVESRVTNSNFFTLNTATQGSYIFRVRAENYLGVFSEYSTPTIPIAASRPQMRMTSVSGWFTVAFEF